MPFVKTKQRIDCRKCRYYFVTWEPARPHGCRRMGFKSHQLPSQLVLLASGETCRAYAAKSIHRKSH